MLKADFTITPILLSADDPYADHIQAWTLEYWIIVIMAAVFILLGSLFLWIYYKQKNDGSLMEKYGDKSAGSYKGFWARNRGAVYAFMAGMFIFFGFLLFLWLLGIIGDITYDPT